MLHLLEDGLAGVGVLNRRGDSTPVESVYASPNGRTMMDSDGDLAGVNIAAMVCTGRENTA